LVQAKDRAQQKLRQKEEQLQSNEALVADFQKALQQRDSEVEALKKQINSSRLVATTEYDIPPKSLFSTQPYYHQDVHSSRKSQCRLKLQAAPRGMTRGSATSDGQFAYITPSGTNLVYRYKSRAEIWERLPSCPQRDSGLAIVNGELLAVGGKYVSYYANKIFTLRQMQWVEEYPPMITARSCPAVVTISDCIVAIGGYAGNWISSVELLNLRGELWGWLEMSDLRPLCNPSALICGEELYIIESGSYAQGYSFPLKNLPYMSSSVYGHLQRNISYSLRPLPPLSLKTSSVTAASLQGKLVLIGGERWGSPVNTIHQLQGGQWVEIGNMRNARKNCLAINISEEKILIVGGVGQHGVENSVEECSSS
jgi:hypothetical protein